MNPAMWMPLSLVPEGRSVRLRRVQAGEGLAARLTAMGLLPGAQVQVCHNDHDGPRILWINGRRLRLGRGMSEKVSVEDDGETRS